MSSEPSVTMELPSAPIVPARLPAKFRYGEPVQTSSGALQLDEPKTEVVSATSLDVLQRFRGTFSGFGFNTIFRPNSTKTPTPLPTKPHLGDPTDNILQLSLTSESMTFSSELGDVPNRGMNKQGDIILNGIFYTQTIIDTTLIEESQPVIHFEPGLWMRVPASDTMPELGASYNRMASIPHGTTINAQGFEPAVTCSGKPDIPTVSITPTFISSKDPRRFDSQIFDKNDTHRLPQDLQFFKDAGTITPAILEDPNTILRNANEEKDIVQNTTFKVVSEPAQQHLGGGTSNIGFLVGADAGVDATSVEQRSGNANAAKVTAQYWISRVRAEINIEPGQKTASPTSQGLRDAVPEFEVDIDVQECKKITIEYDQIQYSQNVDLNFNTLTWPHVTVGTLAPTKGHKLSEVIVE